MTVSGNNAVEAPLVSDPRGCAACGGPTHVMGSRSSDAVSRSRFAGAIAALTLGVEDRFRDRDRAGTEFRGPSSSTARLAWGSGRAVLLGAQ